MMTLCFSWCGLERHQHQVWWLPHWGRWPGRHSSQQTWSWPAHCGEAKSTLNLDKWNDLNVSVKRPGRWKRSKPTFMGWLSAWCGHLGWALSSVWGSSGLMRCCTNIKVLIPHPVQSSASQRKLNKWKYCHVIPLAFRETNFVQNCPLIHTLKK